MKLNQLFKRKSVGDYLATLKSRMVVQAVGFVRGFFVARFLGPESYGILTAVRMISQLEKYGKLGFSAVVVREAPYCQSRGEHDKLLQVKDSGYSGEITLAAVLCMIGLVAASQSSSLTVGTAIALASLGLLAGKCYGLATTEALVESRFKIRARVNMWVELGNSLAILGLVYWLGMHGVLLVPIVGSLIGVLYFRSRLDYKFRYRLEMREVRRMLRVGVPLVLAALSFGAYRYAERIAVLLLCGTKALGYYGIASTLMNSCMILLLTAPQIRKIGITAKLGEGRFEEVHRQVVQETLVHVVVAIIIGVLAWWSIGVLIPILLPGYVDALPVIRVLLVAVVVRVLAPYPQVVLISPVVNKQRSLWITFMASVVFFVGACFFLYVTNSITLSRVVWCDVLGYALQHLLVLWLYKRHYFNVFVSKNRSKIFQVSPNKIGFK